MHENDLLIRFLDIFDNKYGTGNIRISQNNKGFDQELEAAMFKGDEDSR
jgi:hypothetical protein